MTKKILYFSLCISIGLLLHSCLNSAGEPLPEEEEIEEVSTDDDYVMEDEDDFQDDIDIIQTSEKVSTDTQANKKRIEKKYGAQWDFCTCVVKSDSVNTVLMDTDDDDEFDKVMARSDYIDSKCKSILTQPNSTPEERNIHQQRVRKCLQNKK